MREDKFFIANDKEFYTSDFDYIDDDDVGPGYVFALMTFSEVYKPETLNFVMHQEDTATYFNLLKKLKVLRNIGGRVQDVRDINN